MVLVERWSRKWVIAKRMFNFEFTPVDTGRKLNVRKTFKRRPGRLLNVLCTCNLRPVSTGTVRRESDYEE